MKKYEQLYQQFRQEILEGYRKEGDRLPSIRSCVRQFHLSQTSVEHAYARLQLEGYIYARPQRGYYVSLSEESRRLHAALPTLPAVAGKPWIRYDFRSQSIYSEENELVIWKQYLKQALNDTAISSYGEARGEAALRISLMRHALTMRGVLAHEEQVVIGASVQALLYQVCALLPKHGRVAILPDVYVQARRVFEDYGMEVVAIPFDAQCLHWQRLRELHPDVLFVHSPSLFERDDFDETVRRELFDYIKAEGILLLEDDHNGELNYLREGSMALCGLDPTLDALYLGSFSRILLPALRVSYMVLSQELSKRYRERERTYAPSASKLEQLAFASYIADGHLRRRITRLKKQYRLKHQLLMSSAQALGFRCVRIEESLTRYHFAYAGADEAFARRLQAHGIAVDGCGEGRLILSFAALSVEELPRALTALGDLR